MGGKARRGPPPPVAQPPLGGESNFKDFFVVFGGLVFLGCFLWDAPLEWGSVPVGILVVVVLFLSFSYCLKKNGFFIGRIF